MGIQLAELNDDELDTFLEDFIQPGITYNTKESVEASGNKGVISAQT